LTGDVIACAADGCGLVQPIGASPAAVLCHDEAIEMMIRLSDLLGVTIVERMITKR